MNNIYCPFVEDYKIHVLEIADHEEQNLIKPDHSFSLSCLSSNDCFYLHNTLHRITQISNLCLAPRNRTVIVRAIIVCPSRLKHLSADRGRFPRAANSQRKRNRSTKEMREIASLKPVDRARARHNTRCSPTIQLPGKKCSDSERMFLNETCVTRAAPFQPSN